MMELSLSALIARYKSLSFPTMCCCPTTSSSVVGRILEAKGPLAIKNTGARIVSYGSPVLPGAMFLLSYYDAGDRLVPICGLPGCAMYNKRTIFDIVLPRLMARDMIYADELAGLGEGGLCLNCDVCTFPNCGFGKGF